PSAQIQHGGLLSALLRAPWDCSGHSQALPAGPGGPSAGPGVRLLSSAAAEAETRRRIEESSAEYEFVERLIPPTQVPVPPPHDGPTPSGWCPPPATPPDLPYMIRRSRMHNVPVYRDTTHGNRLITIVRKIEGDIWALEREVRQHLKEVTGTELPTQVNEVSRTLKVKGHFDKELKEWLLKKGF
uniref:Large ribosomal subunit protein mL49 n=1 Tax=Neogobius melanostomus TaxID=47308 RepID=A0A8C6SKR7_9GOBI